MEKEKAFEHILKSAEVLSSGLFIGVFSRPLAIGFIGAFFGGLSSRVLADAFCKNATLTT
ncbi:16157_t:CDS:2, partial [Cetraspora pellucida]